MQAQGVAGSIEIVCVKGGCQVRSPVLSYFSVKSGLSYAGIKLCSAEAWSSRAKEAGRYW